MFAALVLMASLQGPIQTQLLPIIIVDKQTPRLPLPSRVPVPGPKQ